MTIRKSYTAVVERNETWQGSFETEPQEAAWASEAVFFVRLLDRDQGNTSDAIHARVQISPDGMHWCDEGTRFVLPSERDQITFCKLTNFGGWLRLVGDVPAPSSMKIIVYLALKE